MSTSRDLPLFYREPQALSSSIHRSWRLVDGDAAFAADTPFVPIVASEFEKAAHDYPILFTAEDSVPLALLGLERNNLFVRDGAWDADRYIPAYVRRYPFGYIGTAEADRFILGIDTIAGNIKRQGDEGTPLFDGDEPSALTRRALDFCDAYQAEANATHSFCAALKEHDLLIDRRVDAALPDGRTLSLQGFKIIDADRIVDLDTTVVADWHRNGWLKLVYLHLVSLGCFSILLKRQGEWNGRTDS